MKRPSRPDKFRRSLLDSSHDWPESRCRLRLARRTEGAPTHSASEKNQAPLGRFTQTDQCQVQCALTQMAEGSGCFQVLTRIICEQAVKHH